MSRLIPDQRRRRDLERAGVERIEGRAQLNAAKEPTSQQKLEDYLERVAKYVPIEIIAAFITIRGVVPAYGSPGALPAGVEVAIFAALVLFTPIYLIRFGGAVPNKRRQALIATVSFVVWSYGIGGPFFWAAVEHVVRGQVVYQGLAGAVVIIWSLAVGLMKPSS